MPTNLGCLGEEKGGVRERGKDEKPKPWNRAPPRNTQSLENFLFFLRCWLMVVLLLELLESEVPVSATLSFSLWKSACDPK